MKGIVIDVKTGKRSEKEESIVETPKTEDKLVDLTKLDKLIKKAEKEGWI
jgi:hypothetical protein